LFIIPRQYKRTLALFTISAMWAPACHCRYIIKNTSGGRKITKAIIIAQTHIIMYYIDLITVLDYYYLKIIKKLSGTFVG
jgi:hypothetical protein